MKKEKKFLSLILTIILLLSAMPTAITVSGLSIDDCSCYNGLHYNGYYDDNTGESGVMVTGICDGYDDSHTKCHEPIINTTDMIFIPETIYYKYYGLNMRVLGLGPDLFKNITQLRKVVLPEGLRYIGSGCFENCTNLEEINLPDSVIEINEKAFNNCTSLETIRLPLKLTKIFSNSFANTTNLKTVIFNCENITYSGAQARFAYAENIEITENVKYIPNINEYSSVIYLSSQNLKAINVDEDNPYYTSEDGVLFNKNKTVIIRYPDGKTNDIYEIPDCVENIESGAFSDDDIEYIGLPKKLKNISYGAFFCENLQEISQIPNSVNKFEKNAFFGHKLTDVYFSGTESEWKKVEVIDENGRGAFNPDVTIHFKEENPVDPPEEHICKFTSGVVLGATCTDDGIMSFLCKCGNNYTEIIPAKGHKDENSDYKCDNEGCDYEFEKPSPSDPSEDCTCNCHKTGFMGFIWKILRIFYKLFKINSVCVCGAAHY